jgi:tetratricopeptide (TPR) repeat protein
MTQPIRYLPPNSATQAMTLPLLGRKGMRWAGGLLALASILCGTTALAQSVYHERGLSTYFRVLQNLIGPDPQQASAPKNGFAGADMPIGQAMNGHLFNSLIQLSSSDGLALAEATSDPNGPDLRPVWAALNDKRPADAQAIMDGYREQFPDYAFPADLLLALQTAELSGLIDEVIRSGDAERIAALPETYPTAFACPLPANVWRLGDALKGAKQASSAMLPLYRKVVEECPADQDRVYAIERALQELGAADAEMLLVIEGNRKLLPESDPRLQALRMRIADARFNEAFSAGRMRVAREAAQVSRNPGYAIRIGYKALGEGDAVTAERWFERAVSWGGGAEARLGAAEAAIERERFAEAAAMLDSVNIKDVRGQQLRQRLGAVRFQLALKDGSLEKAASAASLSHDAGQAAQLGWRYLDAGNPDEAAAWFDRALVWGSNDEALMGAATVALARDDANSARDYLKQVAEPDDRARALAVRIDVLEGRALLADGSLDKARSIAASADKTAQKLGDEELQQDVNGYLAEVRLAEGRLLFNDEKYTEAKATLDTLLDSDLTEDKGIIEASTLIGAWSRYRLGQYQEAAARFESLLGTESNGTAAEGLALSLQAAGEGEQLAKLAEQHGGPLADRYRDAQRQHALQRDHIQTAALMTDEEYPMEELTGVDAPWVQAGVSVRFSDQAAGQDRFMSASPAFAIGVPVEKHRFTALLRAPLVDSGSPDPGDPVGTPPPASALASFDPTTSLVAVEPTFGWTYEDKVQPFASIGTTPLTGEVSPLPTGEVGVIYHGNDGWRVSVAGAASARRDSLLSLAGIEDPATGEAYGRVLEIGTRLQTTVPIGAGFALSGEAMGSTFTGHDIESNNRFGIGGGLSYDLGVDGFEFLAIGPSYRFETYDKNENFFTYGHGGYFSPQDFHRAAMDLNFQTDQYKDFLIRGTASVGYEMFDENAAPILPGQPGFGSFASNSNKGVAVSGLIEGAYLLGPRWQLVGFAGGASATDYTEYLAGISLRYTFGERASLATRDLFPAQLGFSQR